MLIRAVDFAGVSAGKGEVSLEHLPHFIDVLLQKLAVCGIVEQCQRQFEAGQYRAKIVADAVEHRGALFGRPLNSPLHLDEGVAGLPDFARAMRTEVEISAFAEILRRSREAQNRPDLIAKEDDRDRQQDDHRPEHPEHENMGVRLVGERAARHQAQHPVAEIDADFHQARPADRIEPERLARPAS